MEVIAHKEMTGHQYYGTEMMAYEAVDSCNTCNEARCSICRTKFVVDDYDANERIYSGFNEELAKAYEQVALYIENSNKKLKVQELIEAYKANKGIMELHKTEQSEKCKSSLEYIISKVK